MSRLEHDIERDLRQIADRATPSPDAWNSILTRIADQEPHTETEIIMLTETAPTPTRRWPRLVAATAVVALVVAGIALLTRDDSPSEPTHAPFAYADALSVADDYFERYEAGDVAGMLDLFAPDATFSERWGGGPNDGEEYTLEFIEMLLEWDVAQGTQLIAPSCSDSSQPEPPSTRPGSTSDGVTVVCEYGEDSVVTQVADRDPVPMTLTLLISADGIHQWNRVIGHPNYVETGLDFEIWVGRFYPEDIAAFDMESWTSVEEARASGELRVRLADEWVAHTSRGATDLASRVCKEPCSASEPDESYDPSATTQPR